MLGEAGLAARDAPAQTAPNRGKAPAPGRRTPGVRAWEPVPLAHTPIARPCRANVRMRLAPAARMALASTDHPPGTTGHSPQVDDPYRRLPMEVFSRFSRLMAMRRKVNPEDDEG